MEAINRIPKVLETVEQMKNNYDLEKVFENYKANVKIFIQSMKDEISDLISSYEQTINILRKQISQLKGQQYIKEFVRTPQSSRMFKSQNTTRNCKKLDIMNSTSSNLVKSKGIEKLEYLPISTILKKKASVDVSHLPDQFMSCQQPLWEHNQSKFYVASKRRKQRQQELRLFLESGNKNLNVTTNQFLVAIGRDKVRKNIQNEEQYWEDLKSHPSKKEQSLNKSLGQICEALETSFISKKIRKQIKKKNEIKINEMKKRQQNDEKTQKLLKDRGIKSLLQKLRSNVESSPYAQPQPINSSRLISGCNEGKKQKCFDYNKKSKVQFNLVPIDIVRRHSATRSRQLSLSPETKPHSILKQSSTVLSRSISTFSANNNSLI